MTDADKGMNPAHFGSKPIADTPLNYDAPDYLYVFVAVIRHLWQNRTDKFGQCSVVELLIKSESHWSKINCIVIKIY